MKMWKATKSIALKFCSLNLQLCPLKNKRKHILLNPWKLIFIQELLWPRNGNGPTFTELSSPLVLENLLQATENFVAGQFLQMFGHFCNRKRSSLKLLAKSSLVTGKTLSVARKLTAGVQRTGDKTLGQLLPWPTSHEDPDDSA